MKDLNVQLEADTGRIISALRSAQALPDGYDERIMRLHKKLRFYTFMIGVALGIMIGFLIPLFLFL
jgi:hypothetical protein